MNNSAPNHPSLVEDLAPGVTCEWLADRRIFVMTSQDTSRTSVDAWINRAIEITKDWPEGQPYLTLIDASSPKQARTPYVRSRLRELMVLRPDLKWYVAMVAPKNYLMQLLKLSTGRMKGNKEMRIFFNRDEALHWLETKL